MKKCKLLYFISEDEYFLTHKLSQALEAKKNNFEVSVVTKFSNFNKKIKSYGFKTYELNFDRKSLNFFSNLLSLFFFLKIIFKEKPDIIQSIALKPILYTSLISKLFTKTNFIFCVVGLGYLFLSKSNLNKIIKFIFFTLLKVFISKKNSLFIFQNEDDLNFFLKNSILKNIRYKIISGSGVDNKKFIQKNTKKVYDLILHSRLLIHKGIYELINALKDLKNKGLNIKLLILGNPDPHNLASIKYREIMEWQSQGLIIWKKRVTNVLPYLQKSRISILPSYREGLPKSLLEAASCGLPLIATDVPGCREICIENYNGLLVPARSSSHLSAAIERIVYDYKIQKKFGKNSIRLVKKNFSDEIISKEFLKLYKSLI